MKETKTEDFLFGFRPVLEALRSGKEIDKILVQKGLTNQQLPELIQLAKELNVTISINPPEKLDRITRKNHQGVIAFAAYVQFSSIENIIADTFEKGETPLLLILDRVTDVRNFGAICRTAECAGVHAIIIPEKGGAQINSDAMKTSAGAISYLPICREYNLKKTIEYLKESGLQIIACTEKTDDLLYAPDYTLPTAIIMGSEEDGVSPEYLKRSDHLVKIPMYGKIESLNVSVAAGVLIYEVVRGRMKFN